MREVTKNKIKRVLSIAVGWALVMLILSFYEFSLLGVDGRYPNGAPYDYRQTIWRTPLTALIGGIFLGSIEVFFLENRLRRLPFGRAMIVRSLFYLLLLLLLVAIGVHFYNAGLQGEGFWAQAAWQQTVAFVTSIYMFIIVFIWSTALLLVLTFIKISDNYGPGVMQKLLLGKYHNSRVEERIFMFLDIRSSTAIAEKLGHVKYFKLLNDFFGDITDSILKYSGEIYQYVGDEIVVSWSLAQGSTQANCIACFFDISKEIARLAVRYEDTYGLVPEFKAGFHVGEVTTGEVGVLKKEIIYSGDVLNTTSRIQGKCNELGAKILISDALHQMVKSHGQYAFADCGTVKLRGRERIVHLYQVENNQSA